MPALSQKRAADRRLMADEMATIAAKFGAVVERDEYRLDPDELYLCLKLPGASVSMGFKPAAEGSGGWGFLGHWVCDRGYLFDASFAGHSRPHHKATTSSEDFYVFAATIQNGLRRVAKRSLFAAAPQEGEGGQGR
ncbi:MAG: hypothetical protein EPN91_12050 [Salinibacterium sp.]|nr:MAG: hypothetical protein EPN91_12050 [Salinibacterium sp.]